MKLVHKNKGTCSSEVEVEVNDDGTINSVSFTGGCSGNLQGISKLVEGRNIRDVKDKLRDIKCGSKNTSCPAQLADALEQAAAELKLDEEVCGDDCD